MISDERAKQLYKLAIEFWGEDFQKRMVVEECAELIKELTKEKRKINGSSREQILGELADVKIMLEQMELVYGKDEIEKHRQIKLSRLCVLLGVLP